MEHKLWRIICNLVDKHTLPTKDALADYEKYVTKLENVANFKTRDILLRFMEFNSADGELLKKYQRYMDLPTKQKFTRTLEVLTLRYGCPVEAKRIYDEYSNKTSRGLKAHYNGLTDLERKERNHGYIEFYIKKHNGDKKGAQEEFDEYLKGRSELSKVHVHKMLDAMQEDPSLRNTNIEFFLKRTGGDLDKAKELRRERQSTRSLEGHIKKYGSRGGYYRWRRTNRLWQRTLNQKSDEEKARINLAKIVNKSSELLPSNVSKESVKFFDALAKETGLGMQYGGKGQELFLRYSNTRWFYYDCYIPSHNLIIEYHGATFHPKPGQVEWVGYRGAKYRDVRQNDLRKKAVAIERGYNFMEVYSDENLDIAIRNIIQYINEIKINSVNLPITLDDFCT